MHNLQLGVHEYNSYSPAGSRKSGKSANVAAPKIVKKEVDESHPFFNRSVVFTGKLHSMTRGEASKLVLERGGDCNNSVTKYTSYLVIGDYDLTNFTELFTSTKMKKAEELINKGHQIIIIGENDFLRLVG